MALAGKRAGIWWGLLIILAVVGGLSLGAFLARPKPVYRPIMDPHILLWAHPQTLTDHFLRHGEEVGTFSALRYTQAASEFLWYAVSQHLPFATADDNTILIYDPISRRFGAYDRAGETRTYFQAKQPPAWWSATSQGPLTIVIPDPPELTDAAPAPFPDAAK